MSDHPWNRPHDPLRPLREQIDRLDRPEPLPLMESPYRIEQAPAFAPEYAATIHEHARQITEWINGEVERGATDALVAALREKGWTVTPPPDTSNCPRGIAGCPLPAGHEHYSRTDEEIRAYRETAERRRLGETVRDVERRERGDGGTVQILVADDGATT